MSSAILTFASRVTFQVYNAGGTVLQPAVYTLEVRKCNPKKHRSTIDFTNSESGGFSEWAPGVLTGSWIIEGLMDVTAGGQNLNFDQLFTAAMDGALWTYVTFWITKLAGGNNPLTYSGKMIWEEIELQDEITNEGNVFRFSATSKTIGQLTRSAGNDVTGVTN